jgi:hypothetical protein
MSNRAAVEVDLEQRVAEPVARGITARELAARTGHHHACSVSAGGLQRWLVKQRLAVLVDGRLQPTQLGLELAAAIG